MQKICKATFKLLNKTNLYDKLQNNKEILRLKETKRHMLYVYLPLKEFNSENNPNRSDENPNPLDENVYTVSEEILYKPSKPISFTNGIADVFIYEDFNENKMLTVILLGLFGFLICYSAKKLYHIHERSYSGILFYSVLSFLSIRYFIKTSIISSMIIRRMALYQDGKSIEVETYSLGLIKRLKVYNIASIARPVDANESNLAGFGFPILIDRQLYIINRAGNKLIPEIMPFILNGKYIDTKTFEYDKE